MSGQLALSFAPVRLPDRVRCSKATERPTGSIWVGRGSPFANPFAGKIKNGEAGLATMSREYLVNDFRAWLLEDCWADPHTGRLVGCWSTSRTNHLGIPYHGRPSLGEIRSALAGRDLACHCHLGQPCHAELLIEIAAGAYADRGLAWAPPTPTDPENDR